MSDYSPQTTKVVLKVDGREIEISGFADGDLITISRTTNEQELIDEGSVMTDIMATKEAVDSKNTISKHEGNIRKWRRMIEDAEASIEHQKKKLRKLQGKLYYVYVVFVDGQLKYVGKGKGDRYKHAVSGASSVSELNRDHFSGKYIEVRIVHPDQWLTECEAIKMEMDYIGTALDLVGCDNLYNKAFPNKYHFWDIDLYEYSKRIVSNNASKVNMQRYFEENGLEYDE